MQSRILSLLSLIFILPITLRAQQPSISNPPQYGVAAKRPILGGACPFCPWGALADEVKAALKPYGYDVQICYNCSGADDVRIVDERRKPLTPTPIQREYGVTDPPNGEVDFGVVNLDFFVDSYRGAGIYKKDGPRKNLRLIAKIEDPEYYMVATRRDSFISDLSQIKEKKLPVRILTDNSIRAQMIFNYYGITREELTSWGGAIFPTDESSRPKDFDVIISFVNSLNNTPESSVWYEMSQKADLRYIQLPDDLLEKMAKATEWEIGNTPWRLLRGMDRPIKTIRTSGTVIFCRADLPDQFTYDVAKALDEQKHVLVYSILPFAYDSSDVWQARGVPLASGAERYYKEKGYLQRNAN
jgi:TRAP-type uncharacterized transport system substrate-binding protein